MKQTINFAYTESETRFKDVEIDFPLYLKFNYPGSLKVVCFIEERKSVAIEKETKHDRPHYVVTFDDDNLNRYASLFGENATDNPFYKVGSVNDFLELRDEMTVALRLGVPGTGNNAFDKD